MKTIKFIRFVLFYICAHLTGKPTFIEELEDNIYREHYIFNFHPFTILETVIQVQFKKGYKPRYD